MSYASKLKATSNTPAAPVNPAAGPAPVTTPSSIQDRLQAAQVSAPVVSTNQSLPNAATTFVPSASAQATQNVNPVASVPSSFVPSNPSATSLPTSLTFTNSQQTSFTAPTTNFEDILRKSSLNPDVCDFQPGRPRVVSSQVSCQIFLINFSFSRFIRTILRSSCSVTVTLLCCFSTSLKQEQ